MKKQVKIVSIILVVMMAIASISNVVLATGLEADIQAIANGNPANKPTQVTELGKTIVTIMQTVGIVVAIVVLLVLGIKYMMGSAEEKAEYKKTLLPYIIGAALVFAASSIATIIFNFTSNIG